MRRLRHLREALRCAQPQAIAASDSAEEAQGDPGRAPVLLSDEQVQRFVADGYLQIQLEDDGISHRAIHREARRLWQSSGEVFGAGLGNDIYPCGIPQLGDVMSSPRVAVRRPH